MTPSGATTIQDVFDAARGLLQGGNTNASFGLGNAALQIFLNQAYTEMWQTMEQVQTPRVRREFYYLVPAYTSQVDPVTAGVNDMGEPESMWERGSLVSVQIATTSITSPIAVATVDPHGLITNADVTVGQVTGTRSPWGRWFVTVIDASTLTLNGSVTDGTAGIGGTLSTSPERFLNNPVRWLTQETDRQPQSRLLDCMWEEGIFKFRGATSPAQILVSYFANATAPTNATAVLGVQDAATFLATRTACLMAMARGWYEMAERLELRALGPSRQADGTGGLLRGFLNIQVKGLQRTQYRKPSYTPDSDYCDQYVYNTPLGGN